METIEELKHSDTVTVWWPFHMGLPQRFLLVN